MTIVIAAPLYPPHPAQSAEYAKELARRLSASHTVAVVAYARLPERLPGVVVHAVPIGLRRSARLLAFLRTLKRATVGAEHVVLVNGPSAELPTALLSMLRMLRIPITLVNADHDAETRSSRSPFLFLARVAANAVALRRIDVVPPPRPEILPFAPYPTNAISAYERAWQEHLKALSFTTP